MREFGSQLHAFNANTTFIGSFVSRSSGEADTVEVGIGSYAVEGAPYGSALAVIGALPSGEPWARLSVNVEHVTPNLHGFEFVVHHDVREYLDRQLSPVGHLFVDTGRRVSYGFVQDAPVYRLADAVIARLVERQRGLAMGLGA